jgi:hypothetical protein
MLMTKGHIKTPRVDAGIEAENRLQRKPETQSLHFLYIFINLSAVAEPISSGVRFLFGLFRDDYHIW